MIKGIKIKIFYVLAIAFLVLLTGCDKGSNKATDVETKVDSSENGTAGSNDQTSEEVTKGPTPVPTEVPTAIPTAVPTEELKAKFNASRIPGVADWSGLKKTPYKLEACTMWGSMYDFRLNDLTNLDLSGEYESMKKIIFNSLTKWPENLPEGFDPENVMELGKNPGLGIRSLQEKGITGKGVNIAIIDQPLLLQHVEYCNQIKLYEEGNASGEASMHGPFVASLAVGKNTGVAPDAGLYFIGAFNHNVTGLDYTHYADAIDRLLEINKDLPKEQKIRVISISVGWCTENKGYDEITAAIERAKKEGIFVVSGNLFETYGFWQYGLDKEPLSDPENPESYMIFDWDTWMKQVSNIEGFPEYYEEKIAKDFKEEMLLVPIDSRTYAEPIGEDVYCFSRPGGWSAMMPYIAGLYAMACQVKPDITPEIFWKAALETGDSREVTRGDEKYPARMLNPVALIESLQK